MFECSFNQNIQEDKQGLPSECIDFIKSPCQCLLSLGTDVLTLDEQTLHTRVYV